MVYKILFGSDTWHSVLFGLESTISWLAWSEDDRSTRDREAGTDRHVHRVSDQDALLRAGGGPWRCGQPLGTQATEISQLKMCKDLLRTCALTTLVWRGLDRI